MIYNCLGSNAFEVNTSSYPPDKLITGALFNRTACRAKGEPLLPSMFRGNTKVVLYNIQKGKIVDQKKYTLVDKVKLDEVSLAGNYNLCVLDKPVHTDSVNQCFDGTLIYTAYFKPKLKGLLGSYGNRFDLSWESNDEKVAKEKLLEGFKNRLDKELEGFGKVVEEIMKQIESTMTF